MESINKLLKVSGVHYFHTPNINGMDNIALNWNSKRLLAHGIFPPMHLNAFTMQNITLFALRSGFNPRCERNAAKRFLKDTRLEHPHMKFIVVEDALASNAPHIKLLQELNYSYILGAKQKDHKFLFDWVDNTPTTATEESVDEKGIIHRFRYLNNAPLNDANFELEINFLEYWEIKPNGKSTHFSWVTDIPITSDNMMQLMRGTRARWKVENETFNTLKNQGYHFEHNFGHGYHHLSTVMVHLMMLAFLIDQIQQRCCVIFNQALDKAKSKTRFWHKIRNLFQSFLIPHWEAMYLGIANELKPTIIPYNTS